MNFQEYQQRAAQFAEYRGECYPFLGLAEETGEFLGLAAKIERGDDVVARFGSREAVREKAIKEAGDVLWMLSECLTVMGISLETVAQANLDKLLDRKARGVIKGSGDNR